MLERKVAGLHVRESGSGEPVLLVHAFPLDSRLYEPQLATSFDGFRLLAPDLPGFGLTPAGAMSGMDDYANALIGVLDAEDIDRCVVGGVSMGGYVAFAMLRLAPERFTAVVLADTRMGPDSPEAQDGREQAARRVEAEGTAPVVEDLLPRLLAPATLQGRPDVVERVRRMGTQSSPEGVAAALRAMAGRADATTIADEIRVPALVVVGEHDALTPPAEAAAMHERLAGSRLEIITGAGHLSCLEVPDEFNDVLREFLRSLG